MRPATWPIGLLVALAVGCSGGSAADDVTVPDAGIDAPISGGRYDSPDDFDHTGCAPGSFAGRDPQGIYHLQIDFDGFRTTTAARFDVLGPGVFDGVLAGRDVTAALASDDDLFLYRSLDADNSRSLDLCAVDASGAVTGQYAFCNSQDCILARVTGKKVERLAEAPSSGLTLLGEYANGAWADGITVNVRVAGNLAYLARYQDGLRIVDITNPGGMVDVGHAPCEDTSGSEIYNDVKLLTVGPATYAIMASNVAGAVVWDVSRPATPALVAHLGTPVGSRPLDVHTLFLVGTTAYLANVDLGLEIWDLADPAHPVKLGQLPTPPGPGDELLHDLMIRGDRAYLNFWSVGMVVADVSDPTAPVALGTFADYGETTSHSSWVTTVGARQIAAHGDEQWGSHLRLVDVTENTPGFTHQVGEWQTRPEVSAHNLMAFGTTVFAAYYQDGIRVIDIADPAAPRQVAWFNTWPGYDRTYGRSFYEGAVGLDVDLARRRIYVADSNRGLMILADTRQ